jgi:hypothetical protein
VVGGPAPGDGAALVGLAVLSRGVVVGVDGVARASAELDDELLPTKELEHVFEQHPCTSCSALQANSNN